MKYVLIPSEGDRLQQKDPPSSFSHISAAILAGVGFFLFVLYN